MPPDLLCCKQQDRPVCVCLCLSVCVYVCVSLHVELYVHINQAWELICMPDWWQNHAGCNSTAAKPACCNKEGGRKLGMSCCSRMILTCNRCVERHDFYRMRLLLLIK